MIDKIILPSITPIEPIHPTKKISAKRKAELIKKNSRHKKRKEEGSVNKATEKNKKKGTQIDIQV